MMRSSVASAGQRPPQIADQCPGDQHRQHGPEHDPAFGSASRRHVQVDEPDQAHRFVVGLDADPFAEHEADALRLGDADRSASIMFHRPFPFTAGIDRRAQAHVEASS